MKEILGKSRLTKDTYNNNASGAPQHVTKLHVQKVKQRKPTNLNK